MSAPVYTAWPTADDVQASLLAAGATLRGGDEQKAQRIASITDAVTAEVTRRTLRQFQVDAEPVLRYYDGTGTPELEVDEFVTFVGAAAIGLNADPGYTLSNVIVYYEQGKPQRRLMRGQGGLPAFQPAAVYSPIPTIFPAGRQNIAVTCNWGYAAEIPRDLWHAVCNEIARKLLSEAIFTQDPLTGGAGAVKQIGGGDEKILYTGSADVTDWGKQFSRLVKEYKRPTGRGVRMMHSPMT